MGAVFSCRGLTKRYLGESVIEDINLDLAAGSVVSIIGPSGVGKTTLFNALSGVDKSDEGKVFLAGEDITGQSGRVSYMMQKDLLLEYRTILDNVILPLLIRGEKKKKAREYGSDFFPRFGLEGCEKKYPRQLSGGMRQRAALLRTCLAHTAASSAAPKPAAPESAAPAPQPTVILLDEPFSALDAITRRSMQGWFQEIAASMGFSALFITHDIEEAIVLSDTVYLLTGKPGRISAAFPVAAPRPRDEGFSVSGEFMELKKRILAGIKY